MRKKAKKFTRMQEDPERTKEEKAHEIQGPILCPQSIRRCHLTDHICNNHKAGLLLLLCTHVQFVSRTSLLAPIQSNALPKRLWMALTMMTTHVIRKWQ
jgi:hypothetical protein